MDKMDPGIAHEQEAIAEFDKIKESFVQSSPTEEAGIPAAEEAAPAAGHGLDDAYSEETLSAEAAAAGTAAAETAAEVPAAEPAAEAAAEAETEGESPEEAAEAVALLPGAADGAGHA